MDAGGQGVVKSQTLGVQDTFIRRNRQFIDANRKASAQRALASKVDELNERLKLKQSMKQMVLYEQLFQNLNKLCVSQLKRSQLLKLEKQRRNNACCSRDR
jgi:hypothetical protein